MVFVWPSETQNVKRRNEAANDTALRLLKLQQFLRRLPMFNVLYLSHSVISPRDCNLWFGLISLDLVIVCRHRRILQSEREYVRSMSPWLEKSLGLPASLCFFCIRIEMCFWCILSRVFFYDVVTGFIVLVDKANGLLVDISGALDGQSRLWATERLSVIMVIGHLERSSANVCRFLSLPNFYWFGYLAGFRHLFLFSQRPPIYNRFG